MYHARHVIGLLSLAVGLSTAGCTGSGGVAIFSKSPGEVVKAAYMAANAGQYSDAEKYLSFEALNVIKGDLGGTRRRDEGCMWDQTTRDGTIDRIEILKEDVRGEGAKVLFRIHFKDGKKEDDDEPLIKENGHWKITIG
jgi:hypothetical protein